MNHTNDELNAWLSSEKQDAIDAFEKQGMTLRFVDGSANAHQQHPSLAVGFKGVGFTFQMNRAMRGEVGSIVEDALQRRDDFQKAFMSVSERYGSNPLPFNESRFVAAPLLIRGRSWDVCNHRGKTSEREGKANRLHWQRHGLIDSGLDIVAMVENLCERQAMMDRLQTTEGALELVREPNALLWRESLDAFALKEDPECLLMLEFEDNGNGRSVSTQALYWDSKYSNFFPLGSTSCAKLSEQGVVVHNDGFGSLTRNIDASDLGLEQGSMDTMADMGMKPIDILRFDAQKAVSEVSAGDDYLASLDGNAFLAEQDQVQGTMR